MRKNTNSFLAAVLAGLIVVNAYTPVYSQEPNDELVPVSGLGSGNINEMSIPVNAYMNFSYTVSVPAQLEFVRADQTAFVNTSVEEVTGITTYSRYKFKTFDTELNNIDNNGTYYCVAPVEVQTEGNMGSNYIALYVDAPTMVTTDGNIETEATVAGPKDPMLFWRNFIDQGPNTRIPISGSDTIGTYGVDCIAKVEAMRDEIGEYTSAISEESLDDDVKELLDFYYKYNQFCIANKVTNKSIGNYDSLMYYINPEGENEYHYTSEDMEVYMQYKKISYVGYPPDDSDFYQIVGITKEQYAQIWETEPLQQLMQMFRLQNEYCIENHYTNTSINPYVEWASLKYPYVNADNYDQLAPGIEDLSSIDRYYALSDSAELSYPDDKVIEEYMNEMGYTRDSILNIATSDPVQSLKPILRKYTQYCIENRYCSPYNIIYNMILQISNEQAQVCYDDKHWQSIMDYRQMKNAEQWQTSGKLAKFENYIIPMSNDYFKDEATHIVNNSTLGISPATSTSFILRSNFDHSGIYEGNMTIRFSLLRTNNDGHNPGSLL